jgi:hypothetical protein
LIVAFDFAHTTHVASASETGEFGIYRRIACHHGGSGLGHVVREGEVRIDMMLLLLLVIMLNVVVELVLVLLLLSDSFRGS